MPAGADESPVAGGTDAEPLAAPTTWPSAWRHLYGPLRDRSVFVLTTMFLTGIGLMLLGDPAAQWWAIAAPLLLLIGPALRPVRARSALEGAVGAGRADAATGRLLPASHGADGWLAPDSGDPTVPLSFRTARRAGSLQAGNDALLIWHRRHAALVFAGDAVLYLDQCPRGIRGTESPPHVHTATGRLLHT